MGRPATRYLRRARYELITRDAVAVVASELGSQFPEHAWLELVLAELMLNAIEHGNLEIGRQRKAELVRHGALDDEVERRARDPHYAERRAWLHVEHDRDGSLRFQVGDEGEGFDWRDQLEMSTSEPSGRGLGLAMSLAPYGLEFSGAGNVITVTAVP